MTRANGPVALRHALEAVGLGEDAAEAALDSARAKLLAVRNRRVWPARSRRSAFATS